MKSIVDLQLQAAHKLLSGNRITAYTFEHGVEHRRPANPYDWQDKSLARFIDALAEGA